MRISPIVAILGLATGASLILVGCDRAPKAKATPPDGPAAPSPAPIPAACMADLPGNPAERARADVALGVVRFYAHQQNGVAAGPVTPGVDNCPDRATLPGDRRIDWVILPVGIDEARTRAQAADDAPEILDACGERRHAYMRDYNVEVARLAPPVVREQCGAMSILGVRSAGK